MTLLEFLRARLDEDEQTAKRAAAMSVDWQDSLTVVELDELVLLAVNPSRVLAGVDAKRRIISEHPLRPAAVPVPGAPAYGCETCHDHSEYGIGVFGECDTLKLLALPYASHPDYREEWRP